MTDEQMLATAIARLVLETVAAFALGFMLAGAWCIPRDWLQRRKRRRARHLPLGTPASFDVLDKETR